MTERAWTLLDVLIIAICLLALERVYGPPIREMRDCMKYGGRRDLCAYGIDRRYIFEHGGP